MKLIGFLFLAFLATSYANQALLKGLAKINQDPAGAAILSVISLNIKAKTPLGDVRDLLQEILNEHLADSQQFEANAASENERLTDAIANDEALNAAYQSAIATLQDTVANAEASLATAQESQQNDQDALAAEQQAVADRTAAAAERVPAFDADISDLGAAIDAINEAIGKMRTYQQSAEGSASFIQMGTSVKDKLKQVVDTVQGMKKKLAKHSNMFTPLIRELIDLSATISQSKSEKVIDLLNQLLNLLSNALNQTENDRATYVTNYQNQQAQSQETVEGLEAKLVDLEQAISGLNDRISQAQANLEVTQQNLAANQEKLSADQAELEALQADYTTRRGQFDRLIELIRQAINFFDQNLAEVDSYVAQQIEASL